MSFYNAMTELYRQAAEAESNEKKGELMQAAMAMANLSGAESMAILVDIVVQYMQETEKEADPAEMTGTRQMLWIVEPLMKDRPLNKEELDKLTKAANDLAKSQKYGIFGETMQRAVTVAALNIVPKPDSEN